MAKLSIYNEIVDEETKVMYQDWCGTDGVCFKDIHEFLNSMAEDDDEVDMHLHCPGGDCIEGWAIYDALRTSGKNITATIDGECASMATIILLAAPKERRFGNKNARLCIHNPAVSYLDLWPDDRLTADELEQLKAKLTAQQLVLVEEQNKILDLYVERTGSERGVLQSIMNEDKYVDMEKAMELGFISATVEPNTASKKNHKQKFEKMEKTTIKNSVLKKLLALAGFSKVEDVEATVLDQKITAADGAEFTVEREDGDPQVGDKAYPNGTYTLDDGTVIVVANEVIESITPAGEGGDDEDLKALQEQVTTLTAQVESLTTEKQNLENEKQALADEKATLEADKAALQQQVTDLTNEKETLTAEKQSLTEAQKTEEEAAILDIVAKAGGKAWLDGVCQMTSTFHPGNRSFKEHGGGDRQLQGETKTQRMLREQRERQEAKRNAKK
ncbi:MAG: ATP-dependent Clp protease proteolytic subunit [Bacteroidaceae bacterium]|nr:ATP-dependent Clp protease proteolytic subunit [Bacteroidaceae bacterium]